EKRRKSAVLFLSPNSLFFLDSFFFFSHSQPVLLFLSPDSLFFPNSLFFLSLSQPVLLFYTRKSSQLVTLFYFSIYSLISRNPKHLVSRCLATLPSNELSLSKYERFFACQEAPRKGTHCSHNYEEFGIMSMQVIISLPLILQITSVRWLPITTKKHP
ncbi:hypothetical protein ES332_A11G268800v1, partial [Gossypium tomentosum]